MTTWFAVMGLPGSRELWWASKVSPSSASPSFWFLLSSMRGPWWSLSPLPPWTPAHPYDNIPTCCPVTDITVYEHNRWLRISHNGWQPRTRPLGLKSQPAPQDQLWDLAKHLTSLCLWARVSASATRGYGWYPCHVLVSPLSEGMSVCHHYYHGVTVVLCVSGSSRGLWNTHR